MHMSSRVERFLFFCLSSSSLSRLYFLSHCLPVFCPAHQLPCGRNRRGIKPLHSRTKSIVPWRTQPSHKKVLCDGAHSPTRPAVGKPDDGARSCLQDKRTHQSRIDKGRNARTCHRVARSETTRRARKKQMCQDCETEGTLLLRDVQS